jgi:outer membrane protein assembly factor BamB
MPRNHRLAVLALSLLAPFLLAADWPQFRGPGGLAISEDTGLPTTWSFEENIAWKTELPGPGTSSPIVVGSKIILTCYSGYGLSEGDPGDQSKLRRHVVCLSRASGKIEWTRDLAAELPEENFAGFQALHGYASSTPVSDGRNVYVFFGKSGVYAFDLKGKQLWREGVGSSTHNWGSATSPVLHDDVVIVNASVESGSLVGLEKKKGRQVWSVPGANSSWSTPVLVEVGKKKELVLSIQGKIGAFDPENGKPLWQCSGIQDYVCPSVVAADGVVYCIGGRSAQCLAVRAGGKGDVTATHKLWEADAGSNVSSPVVHDGHLYWVSDSGIAFCLNADNGDIVYQERTPVSRVYGSVTYGDGKLYCVSREEGAFVLEAAPRFNVLAENSMSPDNSVFNASPVIHNGQVLLRSNRYLYCIGKKKR